MFRPLHALSLVILLAAHLPLALGASDWTVGVDEKTGLPTLSRGGTPAVSPSYGFWGANWAWADLQAGFKVNAPYRYALAGKNKVLDFDLAADTGSDLSNFLGLCFQLQGGANCTDTGINSRLPQADFEVFGIIHGSLLSKNHGITSP